MRPTLLTGSLVPCLAVLVLAGAGLAACGDAGEEAGDVVVYDSAGVTLVEIPGLAGLTLPLREPVLELEVGSRPGTELYRVTAGRFLGSGRLVIGNTGTGELLYVDGSGEIVGRAGGEGDGPGEFRHITSIPEIRGDSITVYDVRLGRLTVLDPAGKAVETRPLQPPSRVVDLLPLAIGDSVVLAIHGDSRVFRQGGVHRDTTPLMVFRPSGVDTIGSWPGQEWAFAATDRGAFRTEVGFGRSLDAAGRDGRAVLGATDSLALSVRDAHGRERLRIRGTGGLRPVPAGPLERARADRLAEFPEDLPATFLEAVEEVPYHETYPAFDGLLLDADGRVWVGAFAEPGSVDRPWTVFGPDGLPRFRVVLPGSATPLDAAGDRLALLGRTDLAEEIVRVVRLEEPGDAGAP
jgi:hypothetical protein